MGLWDRIRGLGPGGFREQSARRLEREGNLPNAIEAYLEAGLPDEAARLLILRADADPLLERRMAFLEQAGQTAADAELGRKARARRARLSFELLKRKGSLGKSELCVVAADLEAAAEHIAAAEAYALAGDAEGEIRALTSAGAIDRLEARLSKDADASKQHNERTLALHRIQDLDRGAERRDALAIAARLGAGQGEEQERIADLVRDIRQRLLRGPLAELMLAGERRTLAFGEVVTVGRGDATIVVSSRALSRVHLRIERDATGAIHAADAGTRNGTFLRGARLAAAIPVGDGLELTLGAEVGCAIRPSPWGGVTIEVAGVAYVAPLGPLRVGPFRVRLDGKGGDEHSFVVLESNLEAPAFVGSLALARQVELCYGDAVATERGGEAVVVVGRRELP